MKLARVEKLFLWMCLAAFLIGVGLVVLRGWVLVGDRRLVTEGVALLLAGGIVVTGTAIVAFKKQP